MLQDHTPPSNADASEEPASPACVMSFNFSDATGAAGLSADIATLSAMGAHPLPVVTSIMARDTAAHWEPHPIAADVLTDQARWVLEDIEVAGFKLGFLASVENISAVAEILADYPDVPVVTYVADMPYWEEEDQQRYQDACTALLFPQTELLVGHIEVLKRWLLPDWSADRPPTPRELAVAAAGHGARHVLVTGMAVRDELIDNVLASPNGPMASEKFERFEVGFTGAGDTLSSAVAGMLACAADLPSAVTESLSFLDQALDSGYRPGMGMVIPDRFFWALPPGEEAEGAADGEDTDDPDLPQPPRGQMH